MNSASSAADTGTTEEDQKTEVAEVTPVTRLVRALLAEVLGVAVFTAATLTAGWMAHTGLLPVLVAGAAVPGFVVLLL